MPYPANISLPATWEIQAEERTRYDRTRVTDWRILDGGRPVSQYVHESYAAAERYALRLAELEAVDAVLEQAIRQTRHYGIRVWSEPRPGKLPRWLITDPHTRKQGFAFAWYSAGPPPVEVYTRGQYEEACSALDIAPARDSDLGSYWDTYGVYDLFTCTPKQAVTATLRRRRLAGLDRELAAQVAQWRDDLGHAGLDTRSYTREQYERACAIMHTPALPDGACLAVVDQHLSRLTGTGVLDIGIPDDAEVARDLCYRRVTAIEQDALQSGRRCDEMRQPVAVFWDDSQPRHRLLRQLLRRHGRPARPLRYPRPARPVTLNKTAPYRAGHRTWPDGTSTGGMGNKQARRTGVR